MVKLKPGDIRQIINGTQDTKSVAIECAKIIIKEVLSKQKLVNA